MRFEGEVLTPGELVELAEDAFSRARRLPTQACQVFRCGAPCSRLCFLQDVLATLAALEHQNADDPSLVSAGTLSFGLQLR